MTSAHASKRQGKRLTGVGSRRGRWKTFLLILVTLVVCGVLAAGMLVFWKTHQALSAVTDGPHSWLDTLTFLLPVAGEADLFNSEAPAEPLLTPASMNHERSTSSSPGKVDSLEQVQSNNQSNNQSNIQSNNGNLAKGANGKSVGVETYAIELESPNRQINSSAPQQSVVAPDPGEPEATDDLANNAITAASTTETISAAATSVTTSSTVNASANTTSPPTTAAVEESSPLASNTALPLPPVPVQSDPNRLNLLLLGSPGATQADGGPLLTDTIMVLSLNRLSARVALISIPRDLYVILPHIGSAQKINAAYAFGEVRGLGGLELAMETVSRVAGIPIHDAIRVDLAAFEEIINALGGIDVEVQQDFQGAPGEHIAVERGVVHMTGTVASRYVRSRKSTNDFDRSRRQREVLGALRAELQRSELVQNPLRALELLDTLGNHVRTTLTSAEIKALIELMPSFEFADMTQRGFDASAQSPLRHTTSAQGSYILLPKSSDYRGIHQVFQGIFN